MFKLLVIAAIVAVGLADHVPADLNILNPLMKNGRVAGGEPTTIEEVPYQVSLQFYDNILCSGVIISEEWILTAAKCDIYPVENVFIHAGSHLASTGGSSHGIKKFIKHEKYTSNGMGMKINDIALIQLVNPLKLDSTRKPIELFKLNEETIAGSASVITGWGGNRESGNTVEVLQKISLPTISKIDCVKAWEFAGGIPDGQICVANESGIGACQGDDGSPLAIAGRLAGIKTWGNSCARPGYPSAYTEIASYRDWIKGKTGL